MTYGVVTICRNAAETVQRCIESVLAQSPPPAQYVVVDGGSTDGTLDKVGEMAEGAPGSCEFSLVHQATPPDGVAGIPNAWNLGLRDLHADVVVLLNADDWLEPDAAGTVLAEFVAAPDADLLVSPIRIVAEEGDRVEEGDTLLFIDDDQLRLAAEEAEVNFVHLEKGFERTEEMSRRKLISKQEFENKRYEMDQARLRRERAKLELEHSIIRVPFSGVITERHVQVGARVGPSSNLFSLIKLDDMITRVFVPGQYLMAISADQEAMITSDFLQGKRFEGWVKRISPVVDPKSGTFKVTVGVRDRWEFMRPGIFVNVQIITDTHEEAVLIPKQAIVYDGGDRFVFAVRDSMASRVKLDGGFEDGESIEALASIEPGTPIIIVGQNGLKDQAKVKIVNADSSVAEGDGEAVVDEADKE